MEWMHTAVVVVAAAACAPVVASSAAASVAAAELDVDTVVVASVGVAVAATESADAAHVAGVRVVVAGAVGTVVAMCTVASGASAVADGFHLQFDPRGWRLLAPDGRRQVQVQSVTKENQWIQNGSEPNRQSPPMVDAQLSASQMCLQVHCVCARMRREQQQWLYGTGCRWSADLSVSTRTHGAPWSHHHHHLLPLRLVLVAMMIAQCWLGSHP